MAGEREDGAAFPRPLLWAVLAHVVILVGVFWSIYTSPFSDTPIYRHYGTLLLDGRVPYRDYQVEYPPLALGLFTLPAIVANGLFQYIVAFRVEVVVADVLVLVALNAIARRAGLDRRRVLLVYTVFLLTVGPIVGQDFDLFPAATTLFALYFVSRERWTGAWIMLGIGIATKLYPALLVPVFAMRELQRRAWRELLRAAIIVGATVLVCALPFLLTAQADVLGFLRYHAARGVHMESSYGSLLLAANALHLTAAGIAYNFQSWNMTGTAAAAVKPLTTVLLVVAELIVYAAMYRRTRPGDDAVETLAAWSVLVLLAGLVTSKVLSPQYLVWLMPLMPLLVTRARWRVWLLYGVTGIVTYYIFPERYMALVRTGASDVIVALVLRNLLLLVTAVVLYRSLRPRQPLPS